MDKVLKYGQFLVILVLCAVVFFQTCHNGPSNNGKVDTVVVQTSDTTQHTQPTVVLPQTQPSINIIVPPANIPQQYQPSTNQTELLKQYQDLVNKFLTENKYKDSIQLKDSAGKNVGVVNLAETVSENKLKTRNIDYTLKFPTITNTITTTITKPYDPVNQVYIGGGLGGNTLNPLGDAEFGFLYKNKKDHIYGLKGGVQFNGGKALPYVGIQSYWKISFRKK